jgi:hypothetical protein
MKSIIPPMSVPVQTEAQKQEDVPALEPAPRKIIPGVVAKPVEPEVRPTLGRRNPRYDNIVAMLNTPAYQRRNVKFIVDVPAASKETLKDENESSASAMPSENSLFD